ncbi:MAG TPA: histidine kinase [Candidatus Baltobacteraceae bacterium]|jgi:signal transduction histidine kinase|nr:histidine kinase [Candidatus Baltobacteraceae bacterium]
MYNRGSSYSRLRFAASALKRLDRELSRIVALVDRNAVLESTVAALTDFGFHAAWIAQPGQSGAIILNSSRLNAAVTGLVIRPGTGLGGRVLARGVVEWVDNYLKDDSIVHCSDYDDHVQRETIRGMIATPILGPDGLPMGVLYAGLRDDVTFGAQAAGIVKHVAEKTAHSLLIAERARYAADVAVYEERQRMAFELHDSIGAMLFAIGARVRGLSEQPGVDAGIREKLSALEQQAGEATAVLRESLRALCIPAEQQAFGSALSAACRFFEVRSGLTAELVILDVLPSIPDANFKMLLSAAKEGLLNVEKHAHASRVVVTVGLVRNGAALTVTDDGKGLEGQTSGGRGFGLDALSQAFTERGGQLTLSENGEGGCSFRAWLPC